MVLEHVMRGAARRAMRLWDFPTCNGLLWLPQYFLWQEDFFQPGFYCRGFYNSSTKFFLTYFSFIMATVKSNSASEIELTDRIDQDIDNYDGTNQQSTQENFTSNLKYLIVGLFFGIVFVKAEIVSWFRIQEMFRLDSFHMYGVIGSAVLTGLVSLQIIKRFKIKTVSGEKINVPPKIFNKGQIFGGFLFGLGWAITGACPGPLFAQIGSGFLVVIITLLSAIAGTWTYGLLRSRLPH